MQLKIQKEGILNEMRNPGMPLCNPSSFFVSLAMGDTQCDLQQQYIRKLNALDI